MLQIMSAVLLGVSPASLLEPPNPDWNCDDPQVQQEMNWCAARDFAIADNALRLQLRETSELMEARDRDLETDQPKGDGRSGHAETLMQSQRAWLDYRDAHCRLEGYKARGGSLEPLIVSSCRTGLTNLRAEELRKLSQGPH